MSHLYNRHVPEYTGCVSGWTDDLMAVATGRTTPAKLLQDATNKIQAVAGNLSSSALASLRNSFRGTVAKQLGKKPEDVTDAEIMSFIASLPTQQIAQAVKESAAGAGEDIGNKVVLGFGLLAAVLWFTRR
jgi:hypothetical protein